MNKIAILFLIFTFATGSLFAGAWTREKNEAYLKWGLTHFDSDHIYEHSKNRQTRGPDFKDTSTNIYGEFGLTPKWTLIGAVEYKYLTSRASGTTTTESGLADLWLYTKKKVVSQPLVLSMQFGLKIPLGYDKDNIPPLGEGQIDWEERILLGKSLYPFPGYVNGELGYRKRMGDFSDGMPYLIEAGWDFSKKFSAKVTFSGIKNLTNDTASELGLSRSPNVFDKEYLKWAPALIWKAPHGFFLEIYDEMFIHGANTAAGNTIGIGLSWQGMVR